MRIVIFLLILVSVSGAYGCTTPLSGPQYDRLIRVSGPNENGFYRVLLPRKLPRYEDDPKVEIQYSNIQPTNISVPPFPPQSTKSIKGESIVVSFPASQIGLLHVFISVYWKPKSPGECGVYAKSVNIGKNA